MLKLTTILSVLLISSCAPTEPEFNIVEYERVEKALAYCASKLDQNVELNSELGKVMTKYIGSMEEIITLKAEIKKLKE